MSRVVPILSASRRIVASRSTVGKAENSSGRLIQSDTIRINADSAIETASPRSIRIGGIGKIRIVTIVTIPRANSTSLSSSRRAPAGITSAFAIGRYSLPRRQSRFWRLNSRGAGDLQHVPLIPAHAGIQGNKRRRSQPWIPAFAGMSGDEESDSISSEHALVAAFDPAVELFREGVEVRAHERTGQRHHNQYDDDLRNEG